MQESDFVNAINGTAVAPADKVYMKIPAGASPGDLVEINTVSYVGLVQIRPQSGTPPVPADVPAYLQLSV